MARIARHRIVPRAPSRAPLSVAPSPRRGTLLSMAARCADPNCSCRSPDLERFTNTVLRRDAARTDYLVIPLIGGVLTNCLIAEDAVDGPHDEQSAELVDLARSVRDLAAAARDGKAWEDE